MFSNIIHVLMLRRKLGQILINFGFFQSYSKIGPKSLYCNIQYMYTAYVHVHVYMCILHVHVYVHHIHVSIGYR